MQYKNKKTVKDISSDINYVIHIQKKLKKRLPKIIPWIGGKHYLVNRLLILIPQHRVYIEPFIGGGSLYFAKEPSEVEIISDVDKNIINFYKSIRTGDIIYKYNLCKDYIREDVRFYADLLKSVSEHVRAGEYINPCEFLIAMIVSFSGDIYRKPIRYFNVKSVYDKAFYKKFKRIVNICNMLPIYYERMKNTIILLSDYKPVIQKYDSNDAFIYLDPPYVIKERYYVTGTWSLEQLEELLYILSKIKGKFLLSINHSYNIIDLAREYGYNVYGVTIKYFAIKEIKGEKFVELLISNYSLEDIIRERNVGGIEKINR